MKNSSKVTVYGSWFGKSGFRFSVSCLPLTADRSKLKTANRKLGPRQSGFTLLELIVVIIIAMVLMGTFLTRALFYQELAEKVAMESVAGALQTALTLQYGHMLAQGNSADVSKLAQDNPMNWLERRPANYAGEFYDPPPASVTPGNWLFDRKSHELIYVPRNREHLKPAADGRLWIRFHVSLRYDSSSVPSLKGVQLGLSGLLFEPVEPYSWF
ncbi:MAG: type II secretion system protein [Gallionella sp.]|nr:type II secretion system protein [Gallionella sp.]